MANHDVVENADVDLHEQALQLLGQPQVAGARLGITGGMIVGKDDGRGVVRERLLQDLARVHAGAVYRAEEQSLEAYEPVAGVEEQAGEHLALVAGQLVLQVQADGTCVAQQRAVGDAGLRLTLAECEHGFQQGYPRRAEAADRRQATRRGRQQGAQAAERLEQAFGEAEHIDTPVSGAEAHGEEFRIAQRACPGAQQTLPGRLAAQRSEWRRCTVQIRLYLVCHRLPLDSSAVMQCRAPRERASTPPAAVRVVSGGSRWYLCAHPPGATRSRNADMTHDIVDQRHSLAGRHIVVGVSGGIAAYKTPILVRRLRDSGADVQVVITRGAEHFVTATTLQAVSGRPVRNDLWDPQAEAAMGHIELARWADLIVIAPATADLMSRLAAGRADDLLCTLRLATRAPVLLAPAMNVAMWEHPATQRNLAQLRTDGCRIAGPESGPMACGEYGAGRMVEPEDLHDLIVEYFRSSSRPQPVMPDLAGRKVLITAGPTREPIDPVRYISNHSSGKQGYALAAAARAAGAQVTLVSGPVTLPSPGGVEVVPVTTAQQMFEAVMDRVDACEVFIGVAAVADYRPAAAAEQKLKKGAEGGLPMSLNLVENPDIIATVAARSPRPFVVGFAAETHDGLAHAREKRRRKGLDLIVLNDVSDTSIGFNSDENRVTAIWDGGERQIDQGGKDAVSLAILDIVAERLAGAGERP
jgi:phosphopantothenoylcysteine decarboxylase / phosphopantothenate---cysteine ligase